MSDFKPLEPEEVERLRMEALHRLRLREQEFDDRLRRAVQPTMFTRAEVWRIVALAWLAGACSGVMAMLFALKVRELGWL